METNGTILLPTKIIDIDYPKSFFILLCTLIIT